MFAREHRNQSRGSLQQAVPLLSPPFNLNFLTPPIPSLIMPASQATVLRHHPHPSIFTSFYLKMNTFKSIVLSTPCIFNTFFFFIENNINENNTCTFCNDLYQSGCNKVYDLSLQSCLQHLIVIFDNLIFNFHVYTVHVEQGPDLIKIFFLKQKAIKKRYLQR